MILHFPLLESNIITYIFCVTYFIYGIISSPIPNYIRKNGILAYLSLLLKGFGLFVLKCIVNSLKSLFCCFGKKRKSSETEESINLDKAEVESANKAAEREMMVAAPSASVSISDQEPSVGEIVSLLLLRSFGIAQCAVILYYLASFFIEMTALYKSFLASHKTCQTISTVNSNEQNW